MFAINCARVNGRGGWGWALVQTGKKKQSAASLSAAETISLFSRRKAIKGNKRKAATNVDSDSDADSDADSEAFVKVKRRKTNCNRNPSNICE